VAYVFHVESDLRNSIAGLPHHQTRSVGSTLQITHTFAAGE